MENIDDIIKQRLQERISVVLTDYSDGKIRKEVEEEVNEKRRKENVQQRLMETLNVSSGSWLTKLRIFWWTISFNKVYYDALDKIAGAEKYKQKRLQAKKWNFFIFFIIIIALCYYTGWQRIDALTTYYQDVLAGKYCYYKKISIEALICLFLLFSFPCVLSFYFPFLIGKKIGIPLIIATCCWGIYILIMLINEFPIFSWLETALITFLIAAVAQLILAFPMFMCMDDDES